MNKKEAEEEEVLEHIGRWQSTHEVRDVLFCIFY